MQSITVKAFHLPDTEGNRRKIISPDLWRKKMYYHAHIKKSNFILITFFTLLVPVLAYGYITASKQYPAFFPPCGLKSFFHLYCPGCGGTRALEHLLHLRFMQSLLCNPLVLFMAISLIYYWLKALIELIRQHGDAFFSIHLGFLWAFLIILVSFFFIRNFLLLKFGIDYLGELTDSAVYLPKVLMTQKI